MLLIYVKNKRDQGLSLEVPHTRQKPGLNHGHVSKQIVSCQISKATKMTQANIPSSRYFLMISVNLSKGCVCYIFPNLFYKSK